MRINLIDILKEKLVGEYLISVDGFNVDGVVSDIVMLEKFNSNGIKITIQITIQNANNVPNGRIVWISLNKSSKFEFNIKDKEKK